MNGEELRGPGEIPENRLQVAGPHGADVTQGLGDHEVWRERLQAGQIEGEGGAVGGRLLADRLIDLLAGEGGVEQGPGDAGELLDAGGKIAFMTNGHQLLFQTEQAEQFGDAGHEGGDASRGARRFHAG